MGSCADLRLVHGNEKQIGSAALTRAIATKHEHIDGIIAMRYVHGPIPGNVGACHHVRGFGHLYIVDIKPIGKINVVAIPYLPNDVCVCL